MILIPLLSTDFTDINDLTTVKYIIKNVSFCKSQRLEIYSQNETYAF